MNPNIIKLLVFISSYVVIAWLLSAYIILRLFRPSRPRLIKRIVITIAAVLLLITSPTVILMRYFGFENQWMDVLTWIGYLGLGFVSFVFTFLISRDFLWTVVFLFFKLKKKFFKKTAHDFSSPAPDKNRRHFLIRSMNMGIMASSGMFIAYGIPQAIQTPKVKNILIPIKNLHPDLEHFRIVQITDIHVSPTIKRPFVENVVSTVNTLSANIVALTGDLMDGSVYRLHHDVEPLKRIRSTHGNFFVTGNHEYYSGVNAWIKHIKWMGFDVLLNEHRIITAGNGRILLAGVTDFNGGQFSTAHISDPGKSLSGAPGSHAKILLAHQPRSIYKATAAGFDLQISGHTHGGQFFPWNFFVTLNQPYVSGLHKHENTWIYVSRGTGYWGPPVRLCAPSEITVLELISA